MLYDFIVDIWMPNVTYAITQGILLTAKYDEKSYQFMSIYNVSCLTLDTLHSEFHLVFLLWAFANETQKITCLRI